MGTWQQTCTPGASTWTETCSADITVPGNALMDFLTAFGRVFFVSDGLLTDGEIVTSGAQLTYAGPSGSSTLDLFDRTWIRPNPIDYPAGSIYTGTHGQLTARYYVPCTQPSNWTPATDGFTCLTFALGQYQPNPIGPNTRHYKALAINTRLVDTSAVNWTPHWFMHGQQVEGSPSYVERVYSQGAKGTHTSNYDIESMFAVDNGVWTGQSLGPYRWGWGTVFNGTSYRTFWQHNSGQVEFQVTPELGSNFSSAFPDDPAVHVFLGGLQGLTVPNGAPADALVGVHLLVPYPMTDGQIQAVFTALMDGLSLSTPTTLEWSESCRPEASTWQKN